MAPAVLAALALAKEFAPGIVRYLTNSEQAEQTASRVLGIAGELTGQETPEDMLAALREDKALSAQLTIRMAELEVELDKLYIQDRQDARARDVKIVQATGGNARANVMIMGVTIGLLACLGVLVIHRDSLPGEVVGIVSTIAGIFGACLRDAFQFEFGSSRGSKEKDQILARKL